MKTIELSETNNNNNEMRLSSYSALEPHKIFNIIYYKLQQTIDCRII